jgi:hypothetical protein
LGRVAFERELMVKGFKMHQQVLRWLEQVKRRRNRSKNGL